MRGFVLVGALLLLVPMFGCSENNEKAPTVDEYQQRRDAAIARAKSGQKNPRARQAAVASVDGETFESSGVTQTGEYRYNPLGKRDPFRSFVLERTAELQEEERGPLEQFDLTQLTVVAVVWGTNRARAMVEDPSGRGYIIQTGTAIGKNDGYVTGITDNSVVVKETYVDYLGDATNKEIEMRVRTVAQGG